MAFEIKAGAEIPPLHKEIVQERVNRYAEASGDHNPIHLDEEFAKTTPAGGRIAHGMLVLAYISEMMTKAFGNSWLTGGKLNVRFKEAARPGDVITVSGRITKLEDGIALCDVLCTGQRGETVIIGHASAPVDL